MWTRSPDAYQQLQESGMFKLPSGRLLSLYKNSVKQSAGLNDDVLDWLVKEADKLDLDEYGREGGLILDEMSIQVSCLTKCYMLLNILTPHTCKVCMYLQVCCYLQLYTKISLCTKLLDLMHLIILAGR